MFKIRMLPANEGDALLVSYGPDDGEVHHILIDCGRKAAYRAFCDILDEEPELKLELFVLSHVDADHIEGAVPLLQDERFKPENVRDVWFNEWRHLQGEQVVTESVPDDALGAQQGEYFAAVIRQRRFRWNKEFDGHPICVPDEGELPVVTLPGGMKLTLLSPDSDRMEAMRKRWEKDLAAAPAGKQLEPGDWERALEVLDDEKRLAPDALGHGEVEWPPDIKALAEEHFGGDPSEPNGSSIAFVAEYDNKAVLFGADAHAPVLVAGIERMLTERGGERLKLDVVKLSHHGSQNNTSEDLIRLVECGRFVVSTNGSRHHHPDPQAIARVIHHCGVEPKFYFNYSEEEQSRWDDQDLQREIGYTAVYPPTKAGFLEINV